MEEIIGCTIKDDYDMLFRATSSLWGMAIYVGWCDIVDACLKLGVNPSDDILYYRSDVDEIEGSMEQVWKKKTAVEIVKGKRYADPRTKGRLLELIAHYNIEK